MTAIVRAIFETELSIELEGRKPATYDLSAALSRLHLLYERGVNVRYA
jgi:hypothetical protein